MNELLKAFAWLLLYPDEKAAGARAEIRPLVAATPLLDDASRDGLEALLDWLDGMEPLEAQAAYVDTFDIGRETSLNLFEHLHGDSKERGVAMLELLTLYREHGLEFSGDELPDFLPAFLEFLSGLDEDDARAWLESIAKLVATIDTGLQYRSSPWAAVTAALLYLAGAERAIAGEPPLGDVLPTIDAEYWEPPVTFGGANPVGAP